MTIEEVYAVYQPLAVNLLNDIKWALKRGPFECKCEDVEEFTDEEYSWILSPCVEGFVFSITITILESAINEPGGNPGINFQMNVTAFEGILIGTNCPYNYTPKCWVPLSDREAIAKRWEEFDCGVIPSRITDIIMEHLK